MRPSDATLGRAAIASLENARRLADDARLLVDNGRFPTGHAVAVLALEELGKHVMCVAAGGRMLAEPEYASGFASRFRSHLAKLKNARILINSLEATGIDDDISRLSRLEAESSLARDKGRAVLKGKKESKACSDKLDRSSNSSPSPACPDRGGLEVPPALGGRGKSPSAARRVVQPYRSRASRSGAARSAKAALWPAVRAYPAT